MFCTKCGNEIPEQYREKVREYCEKKFPGQGVLCYGCQRGENKQKSISEASVPKERTPRPEQPVDRGQPRTDFESAILSHLEKIKLLLEQLVKK